MKRLRCDFCAFRCLLRPGEEGICGVRKHTGERIETLTWGNVVSTAIDPVEKKPLYHFLPGTGTFSLALFGCNFRCRFCQNASIAHPEYRDSRAGYAMRPDEVVEAWKSSGTPSISFTYSEPTVWQDYMMDVADGVHAAAGRTIMVTNGFFSPEARERLPEYIDAFNIDLKGGGEFYRELCRARPQPVIDAINHLAKIRHLEVTTMYLAERHTRAEMESLAAILEEAGVSVWHISRFFPAFLMKNSRPTGEDELAEMVAYLKGRFTIPYIYGGNSRQREYQRTVCPACGALCIDRGAFGSVRTHMDGNRCPSCGSTIYGVYS